MTFYSVSPAALSAVCLILFAAHSVTHAADSKSCVPAREFIPLETGSLGIYQRIHPSGNSMISSGLEDGGGSVKLVDFAPDKEGIRNIKFFPTPLIDEAYPVDARNGGWRWIASPNHKAKMHYFDFSKIVEKDPKAKADFTDDFNQFYHSSAELDSSTKSNRRIRTLLHANRLIKEYDFSLDNQGKFLRATDVRSGKICTNLVDRSHIQDPHQKERARLQREFSEIQEQRRTKSSQIQKIERRSQPATIRAEIIAFEKNLPLLQALFQEALGREKAELMGEIETYKAAIAERKHELQETSGLKSLQEDSVLLDLLKPELKKIEETEKSINSQIKKLPPDPSEPLQFDQPIMNRNGSEVGAKFKGTTKIFKINEDDSCQELDDLGISTSKVSFSYPEAGKKGQITFSSQRNIDGHIVDDVPMIYDRDKKEFKVLMKGRMGVNYPGFTKDGRVVFTSCEYDNQFACGIYIVDPNQVDAKGNILRNATACIRLNSGSKMILKKAAPTATQR